MVQEVMRLDTWCEYHDILLRDFMWCCKDRSVLEIAPFVGHQSMVIDRAGPRKYTLVEPWGPACDVLRQRYPLYSVRNQDIFDFYAEEWPVDVVVCQGLLYHLHSPLYLLELIANRSSPDYVILDNLKCDGVYIMPENSNRAGNRQVADGKKFIDINLSSPHSLIMESMRQLGYQQVNFLPAGTFNVESKHNSWIALFEKMK